MDLEISQVGSWPSSVTLSKIKPTELFYYAYIGLQDSLKEDAIYMVTANNKDGRITVINISDGKMQVLDGNHIVVNLPAKIVYDIS